MIVKIPDLIMKEIDIWVDECEKIKEHPYAELKNLRRKCPNTSESLLPIEIVFSIRRKQYH